MKELSNKFVALGADKETIGFSNSRLAYDEIISKFCFAVETHTLRRKLRLMTYLFNIDRLCRFQMSVLRLLMKL